MTLKWLFKWILKILNCISPAIILVIAYFFSTKKWIIFLLKCLSFIPNDKKQEVIVVILVVIFNLLKDEIVKLIMEKFGTKITIIAYKKGEVPDIKDNPEIKMNSNGVAEIKLEFEIDGNIKEMNKLELVLNLPNWVQSQPGRNSFQRDNGQYVYKMKDLIGMNNNSQERVKTKIIEKLPLIKNFDVSGRQIEVKIKLENEPLLCVFKKNSFKIKIR